MARVTYGAFGLRILHSDAGLFPYLAVQIVTPLKRQEGMLLAYTLEFQVGINKTIISFNSLSLIVNNMVFLDWVITEVDYK